MIESVMEWQLVVIVLTFNLSSLLVLVNCKIYDRCELAKELRDVHDIPEKQLATWICIAKHESHFNTSAMNHGSGDHGIFQISELFWCSPPGVACGVPCELLRDEDLEDDVICARRIHREHTRLSGDGFTAWVVYNLYCKDRRYVQSMINGCFTEENVIDYDNSNANGYRNRFYMEDSYSETTTLQDDQFEDYEETQTPQAYTYFWQKNLDKYFHGSTTTSLPDYYYGEDTKEMNETFEMESTTTTTTTTTKPVKTNLIYKNDIVTYSTSTASPTTKSSTTENYYATIPVFIVQSFDEVQEVDDSKNPSTTISSPSSLSSSASTKQVTKATTTKARTTRATTTSETTTKAAETVLDHGDEEVSKKFETSSSASSLFSGFSKESSEKTTNAAFPTKSVIISEANIEITSAKQIDSSFDKSTSTATTSRNIGQILKGNVTKSLLKSTTTTTRPKSVTSRPLGTFSSRKFTPFGYGKSLKAVTPTIGSLTRTTVKYKPYYTSTRKFAYRTSLTTRRPFSKITVFPRTSSTKNYQPHQKQYQQRFEADARNAKIKTKKVNVNDSDNNNLLNANANQYETSTSATKATSTTTSNKSILMKDDKLKSVRRSDVFRKNGEDRFKPAYHINGYSFKLSPYGFQIIKTES